VELDRVRHSDQPALPRLAHVHSTCGFAPDSRSRHRERLFQAIAPHGRKFGSRTGEVLFFKFTRVGRRRTLAGRLPALSPGRHPRGPPESELLIATHTDSAHESLRPVNGREQTPTNPRSVPALSGRQLRSIYIFEFPTTKSFATENSKNSHVLICWPQANGKTAVEVS